MSVAMLNIRHILFPIDFSSRCRAAAPWVEAVASRFGARVTLISVAASGAAGEEFAHLRVDHVMKAGDPGKAIVDFARNNAVDLIVMPAGGDGPSHDSITATVLRDAECPVWTATDMEGTKSCSVICAVDGGENSVLLMKSAADLCESKGWGLRLVHVVPNQVDRQREETMRVDARRRIKSFQKRAEIEAPLCVTIGTIADGVREEARRHGADLILVGHGMSQDTTGRFLSHPHELARQLMAPALSASVS
jgi:nucleotide-binding universal stress UspA family protein